MVTEKSGASLESRLSALDFFGEHSLLGNPGKRTAKRKATVVVNSDKVQFLMLSCNHFDMLVQEGVLGSGMGATTVA